MEKMRMESVDMTAQNVDKIGALFPNCVTETVGEDGKLRKAINFDMLRQMLSGDVIEGDEAYEFTWVGKKAAIVEANKPIRKTLRPCPEESKDWDTTENLYIEGDNLEVLKLLQESYLGRVKMIYIDPPYNTGSDFVYKDNFAVGVEAYQTQMGMFDEEGSKLVKNTDSNGRFHSDWCTMIYTRLMLARNLLADDGVIFISIDDHEQDNLRKICNEVFGADNFVGQFIWQRRTSPDMRKLVSTAHDYIVAYVKYAGNITAAINKVRLTGKDAENYKNPDNDPRGPWASSDFTAQGFRPNQMYEIITPGGARYTPPEGRCWKNVESEFLKQCEEGRMWFGKDGMGIPRRKTYLSERDGKNVWTWWPNSEVGHSQEATQEVKNLFDGHAFFDYPKPVRLLKKLIQIGTHDDSIVLDFFSGSATTAHAMMQLNAEDGGHRKFIMVQLPELCDTDSEASKAGYHTICDIGKDRIHRAGSKLKNDSPLTTHDLDIGFRILKLASTNMTDVYYGADEYSQDLLSAMESNIKADRTELDLLFGCLLDWGLSLSEKFAMFQIDGINVYAYGMTTEEYHDYADHMVTYQDGIQVIDCQPEKLNAPLIACFAENVPEAVIKRIAKMQPLRVVFRDSCFADSPSKINVYEIFKMLAPDTRVKVI